MDASTAVLNRSAIFTPALSWIDSELAKLAPDVQAATKASLPALQSFLSGLQQKIGTGEVMLPPVLTAAGAQQGGATTDTSQLLTELLDWLITVATTGSGTLGPLNQTTSFTLLGKNYTLKSEEKLSATSA